MLYLAHGLKNWPEIFVRCGIFSVPPCHPLPLRQLTIEYSSTHKLTIKRNSQNSFLFVFLGHTFHTNPLRKRRRGVRRGEVLVFTVHFTIALKSNPCQRCTLLRIGRFSPLLSFSSSIFCFFSYSPHTQVPNPFSVLGHVLER